MFRVRPARFEDRFALARIIVSATRETFRGRVPDFCLDWLTEEESARNWGRRLESEGPEGKEHLLVAETPDATVIALALGGNRSADTIEDQDTARRFPRELLSLQVDPEWHRRGAGRLLVSALARRLAREGETALLVRVLAENPNTGFYERLGARRVGSQPYDWAGHATHELVYAWDDTRPLLDDSGAD